MKNHSRKLIISDKRSSDSPSPKIYPQRFTQPSKILVDTVSSVSESMIIETNKKERIKITDQIAVLSDIRIDGDMTSNNGYFSNDLTATNLSLMNELTTTDAIVTNNLMVDGMITASDQNIKHDLKVDHLIESENIVCNNIQANEINTNIIQTPADLSLNSGFNHTINIPNVRYRTTTVKSAIIDSEMTKSNKIFLTRTNTLIENNESCDGLEIVVVNINPSGKIVLRTNVNIICEIPGGCAVKIIYVSFLGSWIKMI